MLYLIVYFVTFTLTMLVILHFRCKVKPLPKLKLKKFGLEFCSHFKHKIKIDDASVMFIGHAVHCKKGGSLITIKNVKNAFVWGKFLYFESLGTTQIFCDVKSFFNYMQLKIEMENFDVQKFYEEAVADLINHLFCFENSEKLKKYLTFVKKVLKISVNNTKLTIKQNKLKLAFCLTYVIGGRKKRIMVN
ncbi:MAG: hypothetical protein MJ152_03150 [Clostridia bacterium]|nr:hypothetical protein [Clostridia bacterium]